ncbi:hypothetical protein [Desulfosporosinus sp. Sb-LF]|uniref:hypothetical protein n=1 Tax=Desulfosporosinus sp. Sb-LF TaxID=2560027 RepID=UPI00107EFEC1|nr:hypothetical protein [Desulfosporosinus sp. Sb-LF]TGE32939.1 hypothetical protein E4K68_08820 [Desulfosporosinus sp. Sb-LF]
MEELNSLFLRAYRYPYSYVPQIPTPVETAVEKLDIRTLRVPGAVKGQLDNVAGIEGTMGWPKKVEQCAATVNDIESEENPDEDDDGFAKF